MFLKYSGLILIVLVLLLFFTSPFYCGKILYFPLFRRETFTSKNLAFSTNLFIWLLFVYYFLLNLFYKFSILLISVFFVFEILLFFPLSPTSTIENFEYFLQNLFYIKSKHQLHYFFVISWFILYSNYLKFWNILIK